MTLQFSDVKFPQDSEHRKLLKLDHFRQVTQKIKTEHFWDTCISVHYIYPWQSYRTASIPNEFHQDCNEVIWNKCCSTCQQKQ